MSTPGQEQRKQRADCHAADQHEADGVTCFSPPSALRSFKEKCQYCMVKQSAGFGKRAIRCSSAFST